jgi:hypothetical protein
MTPTPQIYRHYNKIEIFNDDHLLAPNPSISDKNQKSSKSHLTKAVRAKAEDDEDDFEDELDDIVLDRVYNANPSHYKLAQKILSEKEERELQRELELLHQKKAMAIDDLKTLKRHH